MPPPHPADGRLDGAVHRMAVRVYYEDTDMSGIVYHANYLRWFERARSDLLRLLGIDQRAAFETGEGNYAVAELSIRYVAPARLGDAVLIESTALENRAASCRMRQRALLSAEGRDERLLAEAQVRIGFVGPDMRARRQPAAWRSAFSALLSPAGQGTGQPISTEGP